MKKQLDIYYPYYLTDTDNDDNFIITIYSTKEDMENKTNGKTYFYSLTLSPSVDDSECCKVKIDGEYYYFS